MTVMSVLTVRQDEPENKLDPNIVTDLMYNFDHVHLDQLDDKMERQNDNEVYYSENANFFIYNITTKTMPVYFTTDNFQIQTNKNSLVVVGSVI